MRVIDKQELQGLLDSQERIRLVAVISPGSPIAQRIPGSEDFKNVEDAFNSLRQDELIVLYCTGFPCISSTWAYRLLEEHGYQRLRLYSGGLTEWFETEHNSPPE